jgi:peptide/nickel transport system ATP-binding protein
MYAGRIAEIGPVQEVIKNAHHPYTLGLMGSIPKIGHDVERLIQIDGAMPRLTEIPVGCAFNPRCGDAGSRCLIERPILEQVGESYVACWKFDPDGVGAEIEKGGVNV